MAKRTTKKSTKKTTQKKPKGLTPDKPPACGRSLARADRHSVSASSLRETALTALTALLGQGGRFRTRCTAFRSDRRNR